MNSAAARACRLHVEAENILEVGETVVAAEAEIIAEEAQHQREGQRLGDDRKINPGDAAAECEPAEHEGERARHEQHHEGGVGEMLESVPVDRQLGPIQEHHEVRQNRMRVDAARSDLAHQIHAHGIAAEREKCAVAERQNAAIAPDQVDRRAPTARSRDIFRTVRRSTTTDGTATSPARSRLSTGTSIADRRQDAPGTRSRRDRANGRTSAGDHASTARPFKANRPRGRF